MTGLLKAYLKGLARRERDKFFPDPATRAYHKWMSSHSAARQTRYAAVLLERGLLSIITPVWDGSPVRFLRELADSITPQIPHEEAEWFLLDNGCSQPEILRLLDELNRHTCIKVHRLSNNVGIVKGLRTCLEHAAGRYVLPVDADDRLYPDTLRIVTTHIRENNYPALLYTDEDKVSGAGIYQPYCKPSWDPVLLSSSAYIAHLGVASREIALQLGAYTDAATEGSADWDLFMRFAGAGYAAIHIPEIVYSWRIHSQSTADDPAAKPYIRNSQRAVMERFLAARKLEAIFRVETDELFGTDAAHFRFVRRDPSALGELQSASLVFSDLSSSASRGDFVAIADPGIQVQNQHWQREALGLFELFPDAVMVGGRLSDRNGRIVEAAQQFGFAGVCGSPDAGRSISDPGYFGQMWKTRSTGAVSVRLSMVQAKYLQRVLETLPPEGTARNLGLWIGAAAIADGARIIYTPALHGLCRDSSAPAISAGETKSFLQRYAHLLPDRRYYPEPFSLHTGYRIEPAKI